MKRGRKRVPSSQQLSQDSKQLRKSSSADALNIQADESFQSDLDTSASQPIPSTSGSRNVHQTKSASVNNDIPCGNCNKQIELSKLETLYLKCCICDQGFHSCCLDIEESLEQYLYVVTAIGGWCCHKCRGNRPPKPVDNGKNKDNSGHLENISSEIRSLQTQIHSLSGIISELCERNNAGSDMFDGVKIFKPTFSQTVKNLSAQNRHTPAGKPSQDLDTQQRVGISSNTSSKSGDAILASNFENQFKTAVLSAVHSEMKSIARRSNSIVVSGFHKRTTISDKDHFIKFCSQFFQFEPNVVSTSRLGSEKENKVQPLLVTFADSSEPEYLVRNAKLLRSVADDYVKNNIFINKHMTYAERKAAYEARLLRRNSTSVPSQLSVPTSSSSIKNATLPQKPATLSVSAEPFVLTLANSIAPTSHHLGSSVTSGMSTVGNSPVVQTNLSASMGILPINFVQPAPSQHSGRTVVQSLTDQTSMSDSVMDLSIPVAPAGGPQVTNPVSVNSSSK